MEQTNRHASNIFSLFLLPQQDEGLIEAFHKMQLIPNKRMDSCATDHHMFGCFLRESRLPLNLSVEPICLLEVAFLF